MIRTLCIAVLAAMPVLAQAVPESQPARPTGGPITLDQAVAEALEQNPDLIKQRLQARSSQSDVVLARSAIYPNLSFNASLGALRVGESSVVRTDPTTGLIVPARPASGDALFGVGLRVSQLLFDGGKWWNNLEAADKSLAAARENIEEQKLTTVFTVRKSFYELVRAQRTLAVLGEAGKRSRDQAEWTQKLYEGGRATQADVYAARANRDQDEVNRLQQEAAVENARQDLAVALGRDPAQPLSVVDPPQLAQDPPAPPAMDEAVSRALSQRPSLKAFALQLQALGKQVDAARGDYWPTVSLNGSYQRSTTALSPFLSSPEKENTIQGSINLNWNLFNGYNTSATVEKARVQALITQNDLAAGKRGVASDVERAVASWTSARTRALVARQLEDNAAKGLELAKARQQVGVGTQLEVRDAELKVTQAQLSRVGALVDSHEAEAALRRATGDI